MKNGTFLNEDYFERLLEEIREIRLSERRFYQKITDIYATSIDYDKSSPVTKKFFAKVQNKMHYAMTGNTAAEIIFTRADSRKEHAESEFEKYRVIQDQLFESDFDKLIKENDKN